MHAVYRETTYPSEKNIQEDKDFNKFQDKHAKQPGNVGTIVTDAGEGRYLTVTLWETKEHMDAARKALGPVVEKLINPWMTAPSKLLGTEPVAVNNLKNFYTK